LTSNHKNDIFIKFNLCNRDILSVFFTYYYLFKIVGNVKKILSEMKNSLFSKLSEMKCSHTGLDLFYCDIARNNHTYLNLFYYDIARNNHTDLDQCGYSALYHSKINLDKCGYSELYLSTGYIYKISVVIPRSIIVK
jgi:predicted nucleic-acid-binding Zn-ribbon protein